MHLVRVRVGVRGRVKVRIGVGLGVGVRGKVRVPVAAPDALRAVEAQVREVAGALIIDTVAPPVAGLVATLRVSRVAPPEAVEVSARDGASSAAGQRGWALFDRHENNQGVGLAYGTLLGHVAP